MRSTWAVVLVHGVGDTEPGGTLGAFLPKFLEGRRGYVESEQPTHRLLVEPPARLPRRNDDLELPPPQAETGKAPAQRFPMHLRAFEMQHAPPGEPQRAVFAEVFWADLSRAGANQWEVLKRTISLVLDLRHISNVAAAYPDFAPAKWLRWLLHWMAWLLCGPVAGLTAFILGLLAVRYAGYAVYRIFFQSAPPLWLRESVVAIVGIVAVAGVIRWWKKQAEKRDETRALFAAWILVGGVLSIVVAAGRIVDHCFPWNTSLGHFLAERLLRQVVECSVHQLPGATGTHVAVTLGVGYSAFAALTLITVAALAVWLYARWRGPRAAVPALDTAIAVNCLQVMLWVLIGTGMGAFVLEQFLPGYRVLTTVITGFSLKLLLIAILLVCVGLVWVRRRVATRKALATQAELPRLLLHPLVLYPLIVFSVLSSALFAEAYVLNDWWLHDALEDQAAFFRRSVAALAIVAPVFFLTGLRNALHIVIDVASHFHRRRLEPEATELDPNGFVVQQRIEARLRRVLQEVLQSGDVEKLTIVAHSQGTVITLDVLWLEWTHRLLKEKWRVTEVNVVTMGSPISHLYQHYFPHRYPLLFVNGKLHPRWGRHLTGTVQKWLNIYRVDDFVGTTVARSDTGGFIENVCSPTAGGHTGYWDDVDVLPLIAPCLPR